MGKVCDRSTCYQGNCPGCKDGQRWCDDPQCAPYCTGCLPPKGNFEMVNMLMASFLVILLLGIFISLYFYGPRFVVHHPGKYDDDFDIIEGPMIL